MCGLTTEWILESAQSLACALIRKTFYALERRTTHSSEWEGTQTLRRERQAHRWPSGWGEQCWLDQQGERQAQPWLWRAGNSFLRMRRHSAAQKGANSELWGAENSFLGMSGHSDAPKRNEWTFSGILIGNPHIMRGVMLALPLQWWPEWLKIQKDPQKPPRGLTSRPTVRQFV